MAAISVSSSPSIRCLRSACSDSSPALVSSTRVSFPAKISYLSGISSHRGDEMGKRMEGFVRSVDGKISDASFSEASSATPKSKYCE